MPRPRPTLPTRVPFAASALVTAIIIACLVASMALAPRGAIRPASPVAAAAQTLPLLIEGAAPASTTSSDEATTASDEPAVAPDAEPLAASRVNCAIAKCVALTFDDGPGLHTARLLNSLKASNTKATFFVLGTATTTRPAVVRRAAAEGHVVASHGWDHKQFTRLSAAAQRDQIRRTASAVVRAGAPAPTLFRPPYGSYNTATRSLGLPVILWNVDPLDWKYRSAPTVTRKVMEQVRPGSIVLLHDIHGSTVDAVPGIIRQLKARGYTLVTVPELLGSPQPGRVYSRR